MKKLLFISLSLWGFVFAQGSSTNSGRKFNLKVHSTFQADLRFGHQLSFVTARPGVQFETKKGHIHQLEISLLQLGKNGGNRVSTNDYFALRGSYEFLYALNLFNEQESLRAYIGLGVNSSTSSSSFDPLNPNEFFQSSTVYINRAYLVPSLRRNMGERFFIDFSLGLYFLELIRAKSFQDNPAIPPNRRSNEWTQWEWFFVKQIDARFGLGFRL